MGQDGCQRSIIPYLGVWFLARWCYWTSFGDWVTLGTHSMKVLTVTTSNKRLTTLKTVTEKVGEGEVLVFDI